MAKFSTTLRIDGYRGMARPPYRDHGGYKALAMALLDHAAREMRDESEQVSPHYGRGKVLLRIDATVWLASCQATHFFDGCGLDQGYALERMGWASHARDVLGKGGVGLSPERARVLETGLDVVDPTG